VRLFLDTSVLLAASESAVGASRMIFNWGLVNGWELVTTPYALDEVYRNLEDFSPAACAAWAILRPSLEVREDILTLDRPVVFDVPKDRPILFGAIAWADVLLTLDEGDFGPFMGRRFYDLWIDRPGTFLESERAAGRLR